MKRALTVAVVILTSSLGAAFFIAMWPYLDIAGKLLIGLLAVAAGCAGVLLVAFTWFYVRILAARHRREALHSRLIVAGDVVAWPNADGITFTHLSAMHEQAKILPPVPRVTISETDPTEEEKVIGLWDSGRTLRDIAADLNLKYNRVQSITAAEKARRAMSD